MGLGLGALAISAGGGFLDKRAQDKSNSAIMAQIEKALAEIGKARGEQKITLGRSEATANRAIGLSQKGTTRSLGEIGLVGESATRQIVGAGRVLNADLDSRLGRRGLFNSSAARTGRAANTARTQTRLGGLFEQLAVLRSRTIQQGATRTTAATSALSRNQSERARQEFNSVLAKLDLLTQTQHSPGNPIFGSGADIAAILELFKKSS